MRVADWVSLFGLVAGPVFAVIISLWSERRRARNERRSTILRAILLSRRQPADAAFHTSINSIPLEFRGKDAVLSAWEEYIAAVNRPVPTGLDVAAVRVITDDWDRKLDELLIGMLRVQGHKERAAKEIIRAAYDPVAAGTLRNLQSAVLEAIPRVAAAVERSAAASEELVARLRGPEGEA